MAGCGGEREDLQPALLFDSEGLPTSLSANPGAPDRLGVVKRRFTMDSEVGIPHPAYSCLLDFMILCVHKPPWYEVGDAKAQG
jgi:hypothetical protein